MNPTDDPLALALRAAKAIPKSARPNRLRRNSPLNREGQSRHSPTSNNDHTKRKRVNEKICSFCGSEPAAVLVNKSLSQNKITLCLAHYYTTRSCRIDPRKVTILNESEVKNQLPFAQDLFSQAFTELQKEISIEAARSYHEMAQRTSDPLSILDDHANMTKTRTGIGNRKSPSLRPQKRNKRSSKAGAASDGGFMNHVQSREIDLMNRHQKLIDNGNNNLVVASTTIGASTQNNNSKQELKLQSVTPTKSRVNPCKRRKMSSKPTWNLILDQEANGLDLKESMIDSSESSSALPQTYGITCSCGSDKVEMFGNITGRNNDVPKAETWGTKRENEVSTRYQCQRCGKIWTEEE